MEQTKIEIGILLPEVPDARDACVRRLSDFIEARKGVGKAHLAESEGPQSEQICIHFDPSRISLGEVRELAHQAGAELDRRYGHLLLKSNPMHARRARTIEAQLKNLSGVEDAGVSADGIIRIEFDKNAVEENAVREAVREVGIDIVGRKDKHKEHADHAEVDDDAHNHGGIFGEKTELIFAVLCGAALLTGWLLSVTTTVSSTVVLGFYLLSYFLGGFFTVREALQKIVLRQFEIDFLMIVAAIGAAALGEWAEGALLLFLFSIGHALEHYAMGRARKAIEALSDLAPDTATVRRDGGTEEVPVDRLEIGDTIIVKPNERIAADGFVVQGESSVNQASITGESVPVDKRPVEDPELAAENPKRLAGEHRVFAGTINESGALEIRVTQLSGESTLARVVTMVNESETQRSPTQQFTDRFERYFVPAVLIGSVLLLFAFLVINEPFSASFYRAMAVLVAASPCALAISTPSAVLSGVARSARGGVLIKGGGPLENLGRLGAIAFDKTGTLTEGKPSITDVVPCDGVSDKELLRVAVAVERLSNHPIAAAIVRDGEERLDESSIPDAQNLQSITGRGVEAVLDGHPVHIGKDDLFAEVEGPALTEVIREKVEELEANGRTTMIVRHAERYLGIVGLMDTPRKAAKGMIAHLRELGIRRMIMISGDNQQVADTVAKEVGIDEAWGDLMPEDKVDAIKKLREAQDVAMVGDGVNDAPAMATATVGIAMGAAGSDVALETADVALMADDLTHLPFAVGLSRQTSRIIRQNLWFSLGMVAFLVPATLLGLRMGAAVLFHEGSTLLVVFNALRLLGYKSPAKEQE